MAENPSAVQPPFETQDRRGRRRRGAFRITALELLLAAVLIGMAAAFAVLHWRGRTDAQPHRPARAAVSNQVPRAAASDTARQAGGAAAAAQPGKTSAGSQSAAGGAGGGVAATNATDAAGEPPRGVGAAAPGAAPVGAAIRSGDHEPGGLTGKQEARLKALREAIAAGHANSHEIRKLFQQLAAEDIAAALGEITAMGWSPFADSLLQGLMSRWGELDPATALEHSAAIENRGARNAAIRNVLVSWSQSDPDAALLWLTSNPDATKDTVNACIRPFFQAMARANPEWAIANLLTLPAGDLRRTAAYAAVRELSNSGDPALLKAEFDRLTDSAQRQLLIEALVAAWSPYQPELAAQWTEGLLGSASFSRAVDQLVGAWAENDPAATGNWVVNLAAGAPRGRGMSRLVAVWVKTDACAASQWLGQFPPSAETDPAASTLVRATMKQDPVNAMTWAASVTTPKLRRILVFDVAKEWIKRDPAAAAAYIAASDMPAGQKKQLLSAAP
jgi:hypothetical protein